MINFYPMEIFIASNAGEWDSFLGAQTYRPFLQSWTMGEVYREIGEEPVRIEARDGGKIVGICQAILVPARRGRHLAVLYGPVAEKTEVAHMLLQRLEAEAHARNCSFLRVSPFAAPGTLTIPHSVSSPLHVLAEHIWYLPLKTTDPWESKMESTSRNADEIFFGMRATARNLIRRAEKEGVTVEASTDPVRDLPEFLRLHDETRRRHAFTPYTNAFFRAQVQHFAPRKEVTLYLAKHGGETIAASVHMHMFGETSYHHGASSERHRNIPASYLLQWTAIQDALKRGDQIYNFWGIAPIEATSQKPIATSHPFAGVTLFKTGFGGKLLRLTHCSDIALTSRYLLTRTFEQIRKWRRGF